MRSYLKKPIVCVVLFSLIFLVSIFIIKNSRSGGGPVYLVSAPLIDPISLQFSDTLIGAPLGNPQIVYIKNIGAPGSQLFVYGAYLYPPPETNLTDFVIDYGDCLGRGIFPDQPCGVRVYFTPKSEGEKKQTITARVPDPLGGPYSLAFYAEITLMGKGINDPTGTPPPPQPADRPETQAPLSPPPPAPVVGYTSTDNAGNGSDEGGEANQVRGGCALQTIVGFNWASILFPLSFIISLSWIRARRFKN